MANDNFNSGYGLQRAIGLSGMSPTFGVSFYVVGSTGATRDLVASEFVPDAAGVVRVQSSVTNALALCVTGRGDVIFLAPDYTTALTTADLLNAETKGVMIYPTGKFLNDRYLEHRATATLPQTAAASIFTVTGKIKLLSIVGVVTTVIQTQTNNMKLTATTTVGAPLSATDICSVVDTSAAAVGTNFSITGTLATAMVKSAASAYVYQAASLVVQAGTIDLNCAASNTGSIKWRIEYQPLEQGARVFAL